MPLKAWILSNQKTSQWAQSILLISHLLKKNPGKRGGVLFSSLIYFIGLVEWRSLLFIVHPLNAIRGSSFFLKLGKWFYPQIPSLSESYYEVQPPVNLEAQHEALFANDYYLLKPLKVMRLHNYGLYITSYAGVVFKNFRIVPESIHGRWSRTRKTVLKDYYLQVMGAWLNARYGDGGVQQLAGKEYLLVHHWFNYYHWLTETLVRLWVVKDKMNEYTLVLPESFRKINFVQQSLAAFNVQDIHWMKDGAVATIENLTLVQNKEYNSHYDPEQMKALGAHFRAYAAANEAPIDFGERIFITRKKAVRRKMVNEDEVEDLLAKHGFKSVSLEDYNILQEANIMSKAKYIIGMHGAGLTNMLFMPPGGKVFELHLEINETNKMHSDVYWKLSSALGHTYNYQFCKAANPTANFFEADYLIDKRLFEENLIKFVS